MKIMIIDDDCGVPQRMISMISGQSNSHSVILITWYKRFTNACSQTALTCIMQVFFLCCCYEHCLCKNKLLHLIGYDINNDTVIIIIIIKRKRRRCGCGNCTTPTIPEEMQVLQ